MEGEEVLLVMMMMMMMKEKKEEKNHHQMRRMRMRRPMTVANTWTKKRSKLRLRAVRLLRRRAQARGR
jgi:hypothetical protein